jgi:hypothetical protein
MLMRALRALCRRQALQQGCISGVQLQGRFVGAHRLPGAPQLQQRGAAAAVRFGPIGTQRQGVLRVAESLLGPAVGTRLGQRLEATATERDVVGGDLVVCA